MLGRLRFFAGFQEVFRAFKQQIQAQIGDDEPEAHYDLAIAYHEMGLIEDAAEQLEILRSAGQMNVEAWSLLATCKIEVGTPLLGVAVLEEALGSCGADEETLLSFRFEIGEAYLAADKRSEALESFRKVLAIDPSHRNVQDRIEELT